jgi:hypothetical protein
MSKKVVSLKDYLKKKQGGSLRGKIVVGSDIKPSQAVDLAIQHKDVNVVSSDSRTDLSLQIRENPEKFFKRPEQFIIDLDCEQRASFREHFFKSNKKHEFFERLDAFLRSAKYRRVRDDLYLVADELYTNFTRTAQRDKEEMQFMVESDRNRIMVACRDPFGTLDPNVMLKNIQSCYVKGVKKSIRIHGSGGAGIGSYLMYNVSEGMIIAVEPGVQTLVLLWMPKMSHHEDRIEMKKDLIVLRHEEE